VVLTPSRSLSGKVQLGLSIPTLRYTRTTLDMGSTKTHAQSVGTGFFSELRLDVGYVVSESIVLGGWLSMQAASTTTTFEAAPSPVIESFSNAYDFALGPKLDFHALPGAILCPFFGAAVGLRLHPKDASAVSFAGVNFEARAGLRWFVAEGASVDVAVFGGASISNYRQGPRKGQFAYVLPDDGSRQVYSVGLSFGLSAWIG
jgi:hypothetical protein